MDFHDYPTLPDRMWVDACPSHLGVLAYLMCRVTPAHGRVVAHGSGFYSTPMLAGFNQGERLVEVVETDQRWFDYWNRQYPGLMLKDDRNKSVSCLPLKIAFIDSRPSDERKNLIRQYLAEGVPYVVVHDTEPEVADQYQWGTSLTEAAYRWDWTAWKPWTTVLSNTRNVEEVMHWYGKNVPTSVSSIEIERRHRV